MIKSKAFKRLFAVVALSCAACLSAVLGGCAASGKDGVNGKDLNIYDIYEAAKAESGNPDLTMDEFLKQYLSYSPSELEQITSLRAAVNKTLLASVSVVSAHKIGTTNSYRVERHAGSGVIIDIDRENGDMTVLTNCHVVYTADENVIGDGYSDDVSLWLYGGESGNYKVTNKNEIPAELIATSRTHDVALLKVTGSETVKKSKAEKANWCAREENYVGETVYAIGNAKGESMSATVGYISKDIEEITVNGGTDDNPQIMTRTALRTSAQVNPGNSGGGLFNADGELVGLITAKSKTETDRGYALTAAATKRVVKKLLDAYNGEITRGISLVNHGIEVDVTDSYSTGLNAQGLAEICEEVSVSSASNGGNATFSLFRGDVIKGVKVIRNGSVADEIAVMREHNFNDIMLSVTAGDRVEFSIRRGGNDISVSLTFTAKDFRQAE